MRRSAAAALMIALTACAPGTGAVTPSASTSPGASPAPSASAPAPAGGSTAPSTTPATPPFAVPVTVKLTVDGKPATIDAVCTVSTFSDSSIFWTVGKLARSTGNIGAGLGILAEGESNLVIHMKRFNVDWVGNPTTLSAEDFKGAANLGYKEGPRAYEWGANGQNMTSGSFTWENGKGTFKMVATMAGDKRANDGKPRMVDVEVSDLPKP